MRRLVRIGVPDPRRFLALRGYVLVAGGCYTSVARSTYTNRSSRLDSTDSVRRITGWRIVRTREGA